MTMTTSRVGGGGSRQFGDNPLYSTRFNSLNPLTQGTASQPETGGTIPSVGGNPQLPSDSEEELGMIGICRLKPLP